MHLFVSQRLCGYSKGAVQWCFTCFMCHSNILSALWGLVESECILTHVCRWERERAATLLGEASPQRAKPRRAGSRVAKRLIYQPSLRRLSFPSTRPIFTASFILGYINHRPKKLHSLACVHAQMCWRATGALWFGIDEWPGPIKTAELWNLMKLFPFFFFFFLSMLSKTERENR